MPRALDHLVAIGLILSGLPQARRRPFLIGSVPAGDSIPAPLDLDQVASGGDASTSPRLRAQGGSSTVTADGVVDFYVTSFTQFSSSRRTWLVCRESVSNCVGIQDDVEAATAQAIRMAGYHASAGQAAQVHVQQDQGTAPWRTVWSSPDSVPRFSQGPDTIA
jgi:hypothetical protein